MRKVITLKYCDLCYEETDQETKVEYTFTVGVTTGEERPALYVAEVCAAHAERFQNLMAALPILQSLATVQQHRPAADKPAKAKKKEPAADDAAPTKYRTECTICDKQISVVGLTPHIWSNHIGAPRPAQPTICPDCGATAKDGTGMGHHRRGKHGYSAIEEAYAQVAAKEKGEQLVMSA